MELGVGSTPPGKLCCHKWKYVKILFAIFAELPNGAAPIPRCLYVNKIYWTSCQKLPSTRKSYGRVSQNWSCGSKNIARIANAQSGSTKLYWAFIFLWLGRSSLDPTLFPPKQVHSSSERHLLVRFPAHLTFWEREPDWHLLSSETCFNLDQTRSARQPDFRLTLGDVLPLGEAWKKLF